MNDHETPPNVDESEAVKVDIRMTGRSLLARVVNRIVTVKMWFKPIKWLVKVTPMWVTPNRVTYFRTLLVGPAIWAILTDHWLTALATTAIAGFLDLFDGALAENRDQRTALGAIIDPIGDKIFVIGVFLAFIAALPRYFWPALIGMCLMEAVIFSARGLKMLIFRAKDEAGDGGKLVSAAQAKHVAATWPGKMKMVCESVFIVVCLLGLSAGAAWLVWGSGLVLILALVFGLTSILSKVTAIFDKE